MKNIFFFSFILIIISFLFFNFLSPKENSEKIGDIIHQREFNSYFRSFTLTTPDSVQFWGKAPYMLLIFGKDMIKKFIKMYTGNQIHFFILKDLINSFLLLSSILKKIISLTILNT